MVRTRGSDHLVGANLVQALDHALATACVWTDCRGEACLHSGNHKSADTLMKALDNP
jgi:hypothetical protein